MNSNHARVCPSPEWAAFLQNELLPGFLNGVPLGLEMLEIGAGPGASTHWLHKRVEHLTVVDVDEKAVSALAAEFTGTNVAVRHGDGTGLPFPDASFDSVGAFTMLHHVPTVGAQNLLLAEALRVLRPGGRLVGSDSLPSDRLHHFHVDDVYNPLDPGTLLTRLQTIGFAHVTVIADTHLKFIARRAVEESEESE